MVSSEQGPDREFWGKSVVFAGKDWSQFNPVHRVSVDS